MAYLKQGQLNQVMFVLVDKVDFASIESGITSNFTQRLWGVRHNVSAAATAKTPSKTISVVRSGVFRATLKAAEVSDFDFIVYQVTHASAADQVMPFQVMTNDDSDLLSALTVIQSMASDAASAAQQANSRVLLNQSRISDAYSMLSDFYSDFQSRVPKAVATNSQLSDLHSDLRSFLVVMSSVQSDLYSLLSDFQSDFQSRVPKRVATDSQLSDLHSDLRSFLVVMSGIQSDIYSALSDFQSDFQSRVPKRVATDSQLSDALSDLRSQIQETFVVRRNTAQAGAAGTITLDASASATNDLYKGQIIELVGGTGVGQTREIVAYAGATKVATIFPNWITNPDATTVFIVRTEIAPRSHLSDTASDLRSFLVVMSGVLSDTYSALSDFQSDFQSRVPKRVATDSQLSDLVSDLKSVVQETLVTRRGTAQAGAAGTITLDAGASATNDLYKGLVIALVSGTGVGQAREIAAYTGATKVATIFPNWATAPDATTVFTILNQVAPRSHLSDVTSDLRSFLVIMSGVQSDIYSLVSDFQSDFQSRVPKRIATDSQLSDLHSDLKSYLVGMSGMLSDTYSLVSDFQSDFQSRVPKRVATDSQLSDLTSDLRSYLVGLSATLSDVYSLTSDLQSDFQSRVPKRVATDSQLSNLHSDLSARIPTTLSNGRMRVDLEAVGNNTTAATNLRQALIGAVTGAAVAGTLTTTQMTTNLTETTDGHYNGRLLTFLTGTLTGQQTEVTAYLGSTGRLTYTALTEAPVAGDTWCLT